MKLIIQIPCYNEEETLPLVFEKMPKEIEGISSIEFLVIDDGSTDRTVEVAKELGVHHILMIPGKNRKWLGRAFRKGVEAAQKKGADIIVNTDGDNQYPSEDIPRLVKPIVDGKADIVIGNRDPGAYEGFSAIKKKLQKLGNSIISKVVGYKVPDAVSGFRAYSRNAVQEIHVVTNFSYTVDSLIQAYSKGLDIHWIEISPNDKTRESRLISSLPFMVVKSGTTIMRLGATYQPFRFFLFLSLIFLTPGIFFVSRFLYFYFFIPAQASGHIQSVVLGGVALVIGVQTLFLGIAAEMLSFNRQLLERMLTKLKETHNVNSQ